MEDVDALLTELARSHGEEILGLRWGAVLAACESEPEREACRLLGRNDVRLDRALKTLRAVNVYASLDREERAHVNAVIRRAFARDRGEDTAAPASWASFDAAPAPAPAVDLLSDMLAAPSGLGAAPLAAAPAPTRAAAPLSNDEIMRLFAQR